VGHKDHICQLMMNLRLCLSTSLCYLLPLSFS
jgi:hypothetical protein